MPREILSGLCFAALLAASLAPPAFSPAFAGPPLAVIPSAGIPQPRRPSDIVGLVLQNFGRTATASMPLTFGEVFKPGAIMPDGRLMLDLGKRIPVQMDSKTFNDDGSVAIATLTVMAPALKADTETGAMLMRAPDGAPPPPPPLNLSAALAHYSLDVVLTLQNPGGSTSRIAVNGVAELETALKNGTANYWRRGPEVTEARASVPVRGSFRLVFNISAYVDGSFSSDVQFNNDVAMQPHGGTVRYDEEIVQDGKTVSRESNITQGEYQDWRQVVGTGDIKGEINIQHDVSYLEQTGAIPDFNLHLGVAVSLLRQEAAIMAKPGWGTPLFPNFITKGMSAVGGRADIGPTTAWNAAWLMTQNPMAARFALGQADAAGSVPWHFFNPATGRYITTEDYPNIWTVVGSPRGATVLTQPIKWDAGGWLVDTAHQPDLSYVAYVLTGRQYYLDQLDAQASWCETAQWPAPESRNGGEGLVVQFTQVRAAAWNLREIIEAAYVNPTGSPAKRYFQQMEDNNFAWLLSHIHGWTEEQGEAYGQLPGAYGNSGGMGPWEQDYLASSVVLAARQGERPAVTFLKWESNFLVGRFLNGANGFSPRDGVAYDIHTYDPHTGKVFKTWAEIEQATEAAGYSNRNGWVRSSQGDYGELALQSLAGIITVTDSPRAIEAYHWLRDSGAPFIAPIWFARAPQFAIVPESDGGVHALTR